MVMSRKNQKRIQRGIARQEKEAEVRRRAEELKEH
jgi:hypothetical protein